MTNVTTKVCILCKQELPRECFYSAKTKFGNPTIRSRCINCERNIQKIKYEIKQANKLNIKVESLDGEIWVPVKDYPLYIVSNLARVKRLGYWKFKEIAKKEIYYEEILLSQVIYGGYHFVTLYKGEKYKNPASVYSLVFFSFNPDIGKVEGYEIDHINGDKLDSTLANLQYIKSRENSSRRSMFLPKTSKYTGVSWDKSKVKWQAHIRHNGGSYYLGRYDNQEGAADAYSKALNEIEKGIFKKRERSKPLTSTYPGVSLNKRLNKWIALYKRKYLGVFATEEEAAQAYQTALNQLQNKAA